MKRIIVVDDDEEVLDTIELVLEIGGYEVEPLADAENIHEHIQNFNLLDGARIGAIADTNPAMLAKALELSDTDARTSHDYETLLSDDSLDALVIATPNFHHIDVLRAALSTGKPILCEKPLCTTLAPARKRPSITRLTLPSFPGMA